MYQWNRRRFGCILLALCLMLVAGGCRSKMQDKADEDAHTSSVKEETIPVEPEQDSEPDEASGQELPEAASHRADNIADGDKLVALTFDDGPYGDYTLRMLEILEREEVHATFYLIGFNVKLYPEIVPMLAAGGHQLGNHTANHVDLTKLDREERRSEIFDNKAMIESLSGQVCTTLRPPFGNVDDVLEQEAGLPIILWSVDTKDWKLKDADAVYQHVMDNVQDGDIILMHDVYDTSIEAAARIIPALKAQGYRFVTVDQLLTSRGGAMENGTIYREARPSGAADIQRKAPPVRESTQEEQKEPEASQELEAGFQKQSQVEEASEAQGATEPVDRWDGYLDLSPEPDDEPKAEVEREAWLDIG